MRGSFRHELAAIARLLTPGDMAVILLVLAGSLGGICLLLLHPALPAEVVEVEEDGRLVASLPVSKDRLVQVLGPLGVTEVSVRNRRVAIVRSPCPQQVCVLNGWIGRGGQMTACAPNRVVVRIAGGDHDDVDAVSR